MVYIRKTKLNTRNSKYIVSPRSCAVDFHSSFDDDFISYSLQKAKGKSKPKPKAKAEKAKSKSNKDSAEESEEEVEESEEEEEMSEGSASD